MSVRALIGINSQPNYDPDAQAWFTASGITDPVYKMAISNFIAGLKADGIYSGTWSGTTNSKLKALYFMRGGSFNKVKVNAATPGTYNLLAVGSPTYASAGVTGNGTSQYFDTQLAPNGILSQNGAGIFFGSNTAASLVATEMGCRDGVTKDIEMDCNYLGSFYGVSNSPASAPGSVVTATGAGFFQVVATSSTQTVLQKDATQTPVVKASTAPGTRNIYILAWNSDAGLNLSPRQCYIAGITDGMTTTDMNNLRARVVTLQAALP